MTQSILKLKGEECAIEDEKTLSKAAKPRVHFAPVEEVKEKIPGYAGHVEFGTTPYPTKLSKLSNIPVQNGNSSRTASTTVKFYPIKPKKWSPTRSKGAGDTRNQKEELKQRSSFLSRPRFAKTRQSSSLDLLPNCIQEAQRVLHLSERLRLEQDWLKLTKRDRHSDEENTVRPNHHIDGRTTTPKTSASLIPRQQEISYPVTKNEFGESVPEVPDCIKPKFDLRTKYPRPKNSRWNPILARWQFDDSLRSPETADWCKEGELMEGDLDLSEGSGIKIGNKTRIPRKKGEERDERPDDPAKLKEEYEKAKKEGPAIDSEVDEVDETIWDLRERFCDLLNF